MVSDIDAFTLLEDACIPHQDDTRITSLAVRLVGTLVYSDPSLFKKLQSVHGQLLEFIINGTGRDDTELFGCLECIRLLLSCNVTLNWFLEHSKALNAMLLDGLRSTNTLIVCSASTALVSLICPSDAIGTAREQLVASLIVSGRLYDHLNALISPQSTIQNKVAVIDLQRAMMDANDRKTIRFMIDGDLVGETHELLNHSDRVVCAKATGLVLALLESIELTECPLLMPDGELLFVNSISSHRLTCYIYIYIKHDSRCS